MPAAKQPKLLPRNRLLQHIVFWIGLYFFDVWVFGWDTQNYQLFFKMVLFEMPGQMALAYVMMYVCLPLYSKRRYIQLAVIFVAVFFASAFSAHAFIYFFSSYYSPDVRLFSVSKLVVRGFYL